MSVRAWKMATPELAFSDDDITICKRGGEWCIIVGDGPPVPIDATSLADAKFYVERRIKHPQPPCRLDQASIDAIERMDKPKDPKR